LWFFESVETTVDQNDLEDDSFVNKPHVWGSYPHFVGPRHRLREDLLLRAFQDSVSGRRALNVGAGQGTFTNRLTQLGYEVVSTELGNVALSALRDRVVGEVVDADATHLPFEDRSFDAVVLGEVLEHVEEDGRALKQAARVLKSGGALIVSVPRNPSWFSDSDRWAGHVRRYTRANLIARVEDAGFDVLRTSAWGFPFSALYHRTIYERAVRRRAAETSTLPPRAAVALLAALLQVDRLFVGVERGALGYILAARRNGDRT
jgi:SAM-dependent methyltransferase